MPIPVATTAVKQLVTGFTQQNLLIEKFFEKTKKQKKKKNKNYYYYIYFYIC